MQKLQLKKLHPHHIIIFVTVLITHGLMLLMDGIYWDGWRHYTRHVENDFGKFRDEFFATGVPVEAYAQWAMHYFPNVIFGYRFVSLLAILLLGLMAESLGARTLITQLNNDDAELLYQSLWSHRILSLPYGYNPDVFKPTLPAKERVIDIGFRGDYYPIYVGHDDRALLLDDFSAKVKDHPDLQTDIQVGQRLDRLEWAQYLNQCRSLIGHEAGSNCLESDENTRHFLNAQNRRLSHENFRQLIVTMRETGVFDPPPSGRIAAPRNFEAMGTKTVQILLPGRYNDMLEAGTHYIELQRDFSNLETVLEMLFDNSTYTKIVERAYSDALAHHTYEQRINTLHHHILG